MNCAEARRVMLEADPSALTPQADSELAAHLRACASCRGAAEEVRALEAALAGWLRTATPRTDDASAVARARRAARRRTRSRRLAAGLSLAAAAGLAGLLVLPPPRHLTGRPAAPLPAMARRRLLGRGSPRPARDGAATRRLQHRRRLVSPLSEVVMKARFLLALLALGPLAACGRSPVRLETRTFTLHYIDRWRDPELVGPYVDSIAPVRSGALERGREHADGARDAGQPGPHRAGPRAIRPADAERAAHVQADQGRRRRPQRFEHPRRGGGPSARCSASRGTRSSPRASSPARSSPEAGRRSRRAGGPYNLEAGIDRVGGERRQRGRHSATST